MAKEGNEELEGELDALVAEAAMDDIQIGDGVIQPSAATMAQNKVPAAAAQAPVEATQEEEDELEAMMAL